MPKKSKAKQPDNPYSRIHFFQSTGTKTKRKGQMVSADYADRYPHLVSGRYRYVSVQTGKSVSTERVKSVRKKPKGKRWEEAGWRDANDDKPEAWFKAIDQLAKEYRFAGFSAEEDSPGLKRYFGWLKKKHPKVYRAARPKWGIE